MTKRYRICKNCDYYCDDTINHNGYECREESPKIYGDRGYSKFSQTLKDRWCGKWTPKGYNNTPAIKASWDEFKTLHILAMKHD